MNRCNVIVVGASAGGVSSLMQLVSGLPEDLDAAVAVALHVAEESPSALPSILSREGPLKAAHAADGEALMHGRIYVAPPGRHLLVKRRTVRTVNGPNENGHRPAIDPLFRTAARAHGQRRTRVLAADPGAELDVTDESDDLDVVEMDLGTPSPDEWTAAPSQFTCPECHGSLF
jgi:chemotaxis response regulator CheB